MPPVLGVILLIASLIVIPYLAICRMEEHDKLHRNH